MPAHKTIENHSAFLDASAGCVICDFCGYSFQIVREMYNGIAGNFSRRMEFYELYDGDWSG